MIGHRVLLLIELDAVFVSVVGGYSDDLGFDYKFCAVFEFQCYGESFIEAEFLFGRNAYAFAADVLKCGFESSVDAEQIAYDQYYPDVLSDIADRFSTVVFDRLIGIEIEDIDVIIGGDLVGIGHRFSRKRVIL